MSGRRGLSAKEREILERQRQVASRLAGGGGAAAAAAAAAAAPARPSGHVRPVRPGGNKPPPPPPPAGAPRARPGSTRTSSGAAGARNGSAGCPPSGSGGRRPAKAGVVDLSCSPPKRSARQLGGVGIGGSKTRTIAAGAAAPPAAKAVKRPAVRPRPGTAAARDAALNQPATAAAAIAAAKSRLNMHAKVGTAAAAATAAASGSDSTSSATASLKRAPVRGGGTKSVASLLSSAGSAALRSKPTVHHAKVEPEDYWRNLRGWDFLGELDERAKGSNNRGRGGGGGGRGGGGGGGGGRGGDARAGGKRPRSGSGSGSGGGGSSRGSSRGYETASPSTGGGREQQNSRSRPPTPPPPPAAPDAGAAEAPLPDRFDSARQYTALWAPLCLAEARAQILSEASGNVPYWKKKGKGPFPVSVTPLKKDVGSSMDYMTVQLGPRKKMSSSELENVSPSFYPNDIVLLARDEETIVNATRGELDRSAAKANGKKKKKQQQGGGDPSDGPDRLGLIGHTESNRRTVDGLWLKVSRKLWLSVGREEMCLLRIGSNVTALREFHALCRMPRIPLSGYVLGGRLTPSASSGGGSAGGGSGSVGRARSTSKANMLQSMGGSSALGKGFAKYARKKFNPSQLGAISAAATEYGDGGFTLVKGPPGTGKTTTLVALLNSLHIRQFNKYYASVSEIAATGRSKKGALEDAAKAKPRLLVCAPSNAAVDNVILKIMEDGFVDGRGARYNPSIVRVGVGQSDAVKDVALESKVEAFLSEARDIAKIEAAINGYKTELQRVQTDIMRLRKRVHVLSNIPWPLSKDWEVRIDEDDFDTKGRIFFVNHKEKRTTFELPPPPEPGEKQFPATSMPEYRAYMAKIVKLVERYNSITSKLERYTIAQSLATGRGNQTSQLRQQLETHILDATHIVMTTLGTAGNRALESAAKFEVVVVDEAAQSVEPSTLVGLQLGSSHAILVGDPQQLPATIFSVSGRTTKYDRSLFQRLEEAGHEVHLLNQQYRMHPEISDFPRRIFYGGELLDGPNVTHPEYGNPMRRMVYMKFPAFHPLTLLDLDSSEERGGTSLSNSAEARLALHLYSSLKRETAGVSARSRVAVITPYSQQASLLRRTFAQALGSDYEKSVEVNTVDAFQGREANIVIFSCVRAAGSRGIGFLSDVRRMNVALTRAKFFLFVIARCKSIVVNPYWRDLVRHARETSAVVPVPMIGSQQSFPDLKSLKAAPPPAKDIVPVNRKRRAETDAVGGDDGAGDEDGEVS